MTYLLIGEDLLVNKEINKILNENKINKESVTTYDLEINSLKNALIDINTISLFEDVKCIICKNLINVKELDELKEYLKQKTNNILILVMKNAKDNKPLYNLCKNIIDLSSIDINKYVKEELKDYTISPLNINLLINNCNNDFNRIKNEVEKLKMYKYNEKEITKEDINLLVKKSLDNNIFDLIDYINKKDRKNAYKIYNELIKNNEVPVKILVTLANNYRLMYQVKVLLESKSDEEIMKILDIKKEGRLYILKKQTYNFTSSRLLDILKELAKADLNIKSGKITDKLAMELFFSKI